MTTYSAVKAVESMARGKLPGKFVLCSASSGTVSALLAAVLGDCDGWEEDLVVVTTVEPIDGGAWGSGGGGGGGGGAEVIGSACTLAEAVGVEATLGGSEDTGVVGDSSLIRPAWLTRTLVNLRLAGRYSQPRPKDSHLLHWGISPEHLVFCEWH